ALLAFRQNAPAATQRIALRGIRPGLRFELLAGPGGVQVGTASSAELARGIQVTLPSKGQARVLLIEPAKPPPPLVRGPSANPALLPDVDHCVGPRKFTFGLHDPRHGRLVDVYAYVNGRRVLHRRGRDIRRITLHQLPAGRGFTLRIEAFNSSGA